MGVFERDASPSFKIFPPPFLREGDKGGRFQPQYLRGHRNEFINPSPFIPLPFIRGEGGDFFKGTSSLLIPLKNSHKEGQSPSLTCAP